jgi:hypothetical protein
MPKRSRIERQRAAIEAAQRIEEVVANTEEASASPIKEESAIVAILRAVGQSLMDATLRAYLENRPANTKATYIPKQREFTVSGSSLYGIY